MFMAFVDTPRITFHCISFGLSCSVWVHLQGKINPSPTLSATFKISTGIGRQGDKLFCPEIVQHSFVVDLDS